MPRRDPADTDCDFMRLALRLAARGLGRTAPNPAVGAVIVAASEPHEVIARGWTRPGGRPHAERVALDDAGPRARGATLYVTLEPCAHHGITPPCADAIIEARIARVVCALGDPDPRVAGQGLARLEAAGIDIERGVCAGEARWQAMGHVLRVEQSRPFVQLKVATGSDGLIAPGAGQPVWVTGPEARAHGHLLRARADAILVGRGTVEADDPELTCRLPGMADRTPIRVVLDSQARISAGARLFAPPLASPVWHVSAVGADEDRLRNLREAGAETLSVVADKDGRPDLAGSLARLAEKGITRLLIEGGPHVARAFVKARLVDEIVHFRGARPAGADGLQPFVTELIESVIDSAQFRDVASRSVGSNSVTTYRRG